MPFAIIVIGILMIVVAIRNTYADLGKEIVDDFTGPTNFWYWITALFIIGAVGYIEELKKASDLMLALVLISLILSNQGFFAKFVEQLKSGSATAPPPGPPPPSLGGTGPASATGTGVGSGIGGTLGGVAGSAVGGPAGGAAGSVAGNILGSVFKL